MTLASKLRIGVVGCGAFGESHLATFAGIPFAEVTAVADVNQERARKLASRYNVPRVSKTFRELCSLPDLDAVSVVTTEDQHLEPVLAALEHGKHVFVEKPLATRLADAEKMLEAAHKTGLILMPGHILRFETKYATVKEQLHSGRLGRILSIYAKRNRPKWQGSIYKRTPLVLETAIHDLDTMLWYTGKKVTSVRSYDVSVDPGKGADLTCATLKFEDGALGLLQTMWLLPDKTPFLDDSMQVVTTSGIANIDMLQSGLTIWREDGAEIPDVSYEPRLHGTVFGALREELSYFALCALEGQKPALLTAQDGIEALRVALALVESAQTDREVHLADGLSSA
jgi:UDP-N-acetylglucosamine 3-dehydrogenase